MRIFRAGRPPQRYETSYFERLVAALEAHSEETDTALGKRYTVSGVTETRTLDAETATVTDVANFIGTLVQDFQEKGILR